jgi:hypothetical protein
MEDICKTNFVTIKCRRLRWSGYAARVRKHEVHSEVLEGESLAKRQLKKTEKMGG